MDTIITAIEQSVRRVTDHQSYKEWFETSRERGDLVVINNSFLDRQGRPTSKSRSYLAVHVDGKGRSERLPCVVTSSSRINTDLKRISSTSPELQVYDLSSAVTEELGRLGSVVFVLIGGMPEASESNTPRYRSDEEAESLSTDARGSVGDPLSLLSSDGPPTQLTLPIAGSVADCTLTDKIVAGLGPQILQYREALSTSNEDARAKDEVSTDVFRIAYNFACEVKELVSLIISVNDLKPITLWGTIGEHYCLATEMQSLLNGDTLNKVSLKQYHDSISNARNRTFHNALPFRNEISVSLPEGALGAVTLRLFTEFTGNRKRNSLDYEDRELVELLLGFTRAREERQPFTFWEKNADVMGSMVQVIEQTGSFLRMLAQGRQVSRPDQP
ncbi:MAG: hypothetical protein ACOX3S_04365 [Anaerolineae bacterium]